MDESLTRKKHRKDKRAGFTLVEIIVVLLVTVLLSAVLVVYSSTSRQQIALMTETAKITQLMIKAKSLALATYNLPEVPCGYGVHIDYNTRTYGIFSYKVSSCRNIRGLDPARIATTTDSFTLNSNLEFDSGPAQVYDVLFIPPDPQTHIWISPPTLLNPTTTAATIYLKTQNGSATSSVTINSYGQISQ